MKARRSFDHLVGALLKQQRHVKSERLGGLKVDNQLKLDRGLDWKLARFCALEDAINIRRRASKIIDQVISVGQQAADCGELTVRIDGWEVVTLQDALSSFISLHAPCYVPPTLLGRGEFVLNAP